MELVLRLGYRSIHVIACIIFHYCPIIFHCLLVLSIVDGHLSSLNIFSIKNNAAINISLYKILCGHVFISLRYIPGNGTAESCGNSMFNLWRNCQTVKALASFYSPSALYEGSRFSTWLTILLTVKWYFGMVLICISLWDSDV